MDTWVARIFFTIMNNTAMNIYVQVFVSVYVFISLDSISFHIYPGVELLDNMITMFNLLKNCQFSTTVYEDTDFFIFLPMLVLCLFLIIAILLCTSGIH